MDIEDTILKDLFKKDVIETTLQISPNILNKAYYHELKSIAKKEYEKQNSSLGYINEVISVRPTSKPKVNPYDYTHHTLFVDVSMELSICVVTEGSTIYTCVKEYISAAQLAKSTSGPIVVISLIDDKISDIKAGDICKINLSQVRQYLGQREILFMGDIIELYKVGSDDYKKVIEYIKN